MSGTFNTDELVITSATVTGLLKALEGFKFPQFTTATRPGSPVVGQTIYNTDEAGLETYNGSGWDLVKGGGAMPVYNGTGNRPAGPVVGTIGFNTATSRPIQIGSGAFSRINQVQLVPNSQSICQTICTDIDDSCSAN